MYDDFDDRDWTTGFRSRRTWVRGFFMLLFLFIVWFVRLLLTVVAVFQFGAQLITGRPVARGLPFGRGLARYLQQIAMFLTYNTDDKPFPFGPWPDTGVPEAESDTGEDGDEGEEGEAWEAYETYPPADAPFAPEPEPEAEAPEEPEPEPEAEPEAEPAAEEEPEVKPKAARTKKKAAKPADEAAADDTAELDEDAGPDEDDPDESQPPRPDA